MTNKENDGKTIINVYKHRYNPLKNKLGTRIQTNEDGHIAPEDIIEADKLIAEMCVGCEDNIAQHLEKISLIWKDMQKAENANLRDEKAQEIFTYAHKTKDIAELCGYTLAAYFAESLRDYISETALNLKNQRIIIQAHIDAMNAVHKGKLKEDGGPVADELKKMVKIAIKKYH
ncbi:MAG: hypothetical protein COA45_02205 [Zetaproteobacteria bacterium]|nr:MAG: hypothetical protein COA45_02205 [Zetaproteobacteria bacterium]